MGFTNRNKHMNTTKSLNLPSIPKTNTTKKTTKTTNNSTNIFSLKKDTPSTMGGFGFQDALNSLNKLGNMFDALDQPSVGGIAQTNLPNVINNTQKVNKNQNRPPRADQTTKATNKSTKTN